MLILYLLGYFWGFGGVLTGKERCVLKEIKQYSSNDSLRKRYLTSLADTVNKGDVDKEKMKTLLSFLKVVARQNLYQGMDEESGFVILFSQMTLEKCKIKY